MGILVIALSINPRPLSALELTLSGLIMGSQVDTAGDNQNPYVIISNYFSAVTFVYIRMRVELLYLLIEEFSGTGSFRP